MTDHIQIPNITPVIHYAGNGTQTVFAFPYPIFTDANLIVSIDGVQQNSGYIISGAGETTGGMVTFAVAPANGAVITLKRNLTFERLTDFIEGGDFAADAINTELDYLVACLQQVDTAYGSVLRFSDAENPPESTSLPLLAARANRALGFDANGNPVAYQVENISPPPVADVTVTGGAARSLNARASDFVSVKDFGAVGNGIANDTNAFLQALSNYPHIFVPSGTYLIAGTLTLSAGQSLVGAGQNTIIRAQSASFTAIEMVAGNITLRDLRIEQAQLGLHLYGRDATCTLNTISGVSFDQCLSGIELDGYTNTARPCTHNRLQHIAITRFSGDAIRLTLSGAGSAPARNRFDQVMIDPQTASSTGAAIWVSAGVDQNSFTNISANITGTSTSCVRVGTNASGTRFASCILAAGSSVAHIRLEASSSNSILEDCIFTGAGTGLDDLSGGAFTARNIGAVDKNRLARTNISDATATLLRYGVASYTASGTLNASAACSVHLVSAASGNVTFQLPNATTLSGARMMVKKSEGSNNSVTITDHAGGTIETRPMVLTGRADAVTYYSDGTNWHIISSPTVSRGVRAASVAASSTYDIDMTADIYVLTPGGNCTARLPAASAVSANGRTITIKKVAVAATIISITVQSGPMPDGISPLELNGLNSAITVASDGASWRVLSRYN